jgi:hypothetical protein
LEGSAQEVRQVFISPREYPLTNRLTIHLLNEGKTPLVPQPASNPNNPPSFRLSFRAGNASDRNALTTEDKVKAIKVQESGGWAASLEGNLIPSTWLLKPDRSEVLAGGEEVQVVFDHVEIPSEFSTGGPAFGWSTGTSRVTTTGLKLSPFSESRRLRLLPSTGLRSKSRQSLATSRSI